MKTRILLLQMLFLCAVAFSQQNDCGNNAGFESGTVAGWICKSGYYGSAPCPPTGACPRMGTTYTSFGQLNTGGTNAPLNDPGNTNRHVIMSGPGTDLNSGGVLPVVAPGGGTYSCRLGNGSTGTMNGSYPLAEAMRINFTVNSSNSGFTYRYACFVQNNPNHAFEEQPSFEVVVLDQNDNVIPCGRNFIVAGNYPGCADNAGFINGANGYIYKNWTDVGLDIRQYIGQNITIEFRTTDCTHSTGPGCSYAAGTHSAYAYIDTYCSPLQISTPQFICNGMTDITVCAPAGFSSYSWPAGQPGITGSPTTPCVTINNPVAGTNYTVNVVSATGCTSTIVTALQGVSVNSPGICQGDNATLTASAAGNYSWNTGATTSSIVVSPSATTTYSVTAQTGSCTATSTATVTVFPLPAAPNITANATTLTASSSATYQWYLNGNPINGATSQSYSAIVNGNYKVCVTDSNGCPACSAPYNFTSTAIIEHNNSLDISIFPNPNSGIFFIKTGDKNTMIEVLNMLGETIYSCENIVSEKEIDLRKQSNGIYFLKANSKKGSIVKKIVINK